MNCIMYIMSYNSTIHATCLLTLTVYKYNKLQVFGATQKLSCKANCQKTFFSHSVYEAFVWSFKLLPRKTPSQNGILVRNKVFDRKY